MFKSSLSWLYIYGVSDAEIKMVSWTTLFIKQLEKKLSFITGKSQMLEDKRPQWAAVYFFLLIKQRHFICSNLDRSLAVNSECHN